MAIDKAERFQKVATARTQKIIDMMRLLGNCANKGNYSYTDKQVEAIFSALQYELDEAKAKYTKQETKGEKRFQLPD